jgi:thiopeptide-type bacteriocin biosynthesis protein
MDLIEQLFSCDSDACLELIGRTPGDEPNLPRRNAIFRSMHHFLDDFGLDDEGKEQFCTKLWPRFYDRGDLASVERGLSGEFRQIRKEVEAATLAGAVGPEIEALLVRRGRTWAPIVSELRAVEARGALTSPLLDILRSLLHMHLNRMLRVYTAEREGLTYNYLARVYDSAVARRSKRPAAIG